MMRRASPSFSRRSLALLAIAPPAAAQDFPAPEPPSVGPPPVQFNFAPPGGPLARHGRVLHRPRRRRDRRRVQPGRPDDPDQAGVLGPLPLHGVREHRAEHGVAAGFETFTDRVGSPSFFSVVYPWQNAAVSVFYQRAADFRSNSRFEGFIDDALYNEDRVDVAFRTENFGVSGAFKLGSKISIGGSIRATRVPAPTPFSASRWFFPFLGSGDLLLQSVDDAKIDGQQDQDHLQRRHPDHPHAAVLAGGGLQEGRRHGLHSDGSAHAQRHSSRRAAAFRDRLGARAQSRCPTSSVAESRSRPPTRSRSSSTWCGSSTPRPIWTVTPQGPEHQNGYQLYGEGGREPLEDAHRVSRRPRVHLGARRRLDLLAPRRLLHSTPTTTAWPGATPSRTT